MAQSSPKNGNLELCEEVLKEDKPPNVVDDDIIKRYQHLVKRLLKENNDSSKLGTKHTSILHSLMLENDEEIFEFVACNTKFDVNADSFKELLFNVIDKGTPRMIRALIDAGADLQTECDLPPLVYATKVNRTEIIHCLLDCGASVNKVEHSEHETNSPLHYAVCRQNFEIVEKLVMMGADVNAPTVDQTPLLLACGSKIDHRFSQLMLNNFLEQCKSKNIHGISLSVNIIECLLDHGANMEAKNAFNRTPLDEACKGGRLDIVQLLLNRGAKINQRNESSTLYHAIRGGNLAIIKLILEQGANADYRSAPKTSMFDDRECANLPSITPLECAVKYFVLDTDSKNIIEILIEYGANVNLAHPILQDTALHFVYRSEYSNLMPFFKEMRYFESKTETIKLLLRQNPDVNALNWEKMVPLHYAHRNFKCYNDHYKGMCRRKFFTFLKLSLMALVAFIAKMVENKEYVIEQNLKLLQDESVRPIYQECVNELNLMKKKNICQSRNFSFFDILREDIPYLCRILRIKHIRQVLNKKKRIKNSFPIYAEFLEFRILEASIRQRLAELAIVLFQKHINKNIVVELIMFHIFKFLNSKDFRNFAKACFVEIE